MNSFNVNSKIYTKRHACMLRACDTLELSCVCHVWIIKWSNYAHDDSLGHEFESWHDRCHVCDRLSLNPAKCAFRVTSDTLLGHVVSKGRDHNGSKQSQRNPSGTNTNKCKSVKQILGADPVHSRMLWYLVDFVTPLHGVVHRVPFRWTIDKDKAYNALKVMLSEAPVVQPPN